jgi:hypothetical protein
MMSRAYEQLIAMSGRTFEVGQGMEGAVFEVS